MDTLKAILLADNSRLCGKSFKIFDWDKAARIIKERKPLFAFAGLRNDWGYTGGIIYANGQPVDKKNTYTYLQSNWATPILKLQYDGFDDGGDDDCNLEVIPCFILSDNNPNNWNSGTYWVESALNILKE
jgi:hypothetical protein